MAWPIIIAQDRCDKLTTLEYNELGQQLLLEQIVDRMRFEKAQFPFDTIKQLLDV